MVLALGLGLATTARAATPVAAWTDFRNLTSGNYTWTVGGNSVVDPDTGVLTIGSTGGVYMDISGIGSDNRSFSIAIEAEIPGTYTSDKTLVDLIVNGSHVSVAANGTTIGQCWTTGALSGTTYGKSTFTAGRQLLTVTFQGASGQGTHSYIDGTQVAGSTALMSSSGSVTHIGIGSYNKTGEVAEGLKIYSVRLYNSKISASDVSTDYDTYGVADYVTTVSSDTTLEGSDLTWVAKDGTTSTTAPAAYDKLDIRGSGTVTSSSAFTAIMNIGGGVTFQPSSIGTASVFTGGGEIDYPAGATPGAEKTCFTYASWTGTVSLRNIAVTDFCTDTYGNSASKVKVSGVTGWISTSNTSNAELILENGTYGFGFCANNANSLSSGNPNRCSVWKKLSGSGKLTTRNNSNQAPCVKIYDATGFTGSINADEGNVKLQVVFCGESETFSPSLFAVLGSDVSKGKIFVSSGSSAVTVASGETWAGSGGIIVNGTLNLADATSTLGSTVTGSGTIACSGFLPSVSGLTASGWTGTVSIAADAESGTEWSTEAIMNSGSAIELTAGMLKVSDVSKLTGSFKIDSGAYLWITDTTSTSASIKISDWSGTLYVQRPNALTSLQTDIGTIRSVATGNVMLNNASLPVELILAEVKGEGGSIDLSGLVAFTGRASTTYKVRRLDGVTVDATLENGTLTYTPSISGAATDIDWDFTDGTDDALEQAPSGVTRNYDSTLTFYTDAEDSTYTGVYLKHHPYVEGAGDFIHNNSSAITVAAVGTMPRGDKSIFMNFGSAYANKYGLLLANTETANEVLVAYNYGATVTPITTMTVPNASTARHSYIITKEDGESSTTFTVYLDGIKWKTVTTGFKIEFSSANTGIQFGSDFGGNIRNAGYNAVSGNTGILNVLRVYGRVITPAEIAAYASAFPYVSPSGSSARTFATAAENWIDMTESSSVWDNSSEADSGTPTEGASLTVSATADTTITVNLADDTEYEALTINGSPVTFAPASASSGAIKVTGMTVIGTTVVNEYGAVDMTGGPMTITEDGDITFDCSAYDASSIYVTTDIPLTSDVDEDAAKVHLIAPVTPYRTYSLVYTSEHYVMRVTPITNPGNEVYYTGGYWSSTESSFAVTNANGDATIVFPGDTVVIPAYITGSQANLAYFDPQLPANVTSIRVEKNYTFEPGHSQAILGGVTVEVASGCSLTFGQTDHNLVFGAVTFVGGGTVTLPTLPTSLSFGDWTGTVILPELTAEGHDLNHYGKEGSTVRVTSVQSGAWLANATVMPTVDLANNLTLVAFSATFANTFTKLKGSGAFSLTADGTTIGYEDGYFLVKDVSDFTGSITVAAPGLALGGTSKPSSTDWYGKIVVQAPVEVGTSATWSAGGVVLAATGATLTVPSGATIPAAGVESGVDGYGVWQTSEGSSTVYSLVAEDDTGAASVTVGGSTYYIPRGWAANVGGVQTAAGLEGNGANGIPLWESYCLGLTPSEPTSLPKMDASASGGNLYFGLQNVVRPSGVTLNVKVMKEGAPSPVATATYSDSAAGSLSVSLAGDPDPVVIYQIEVEVESSYAP